jgi:hypothetical protein
MAFVCSGRAGELNCQRVYPGRFLNSGFCGLDFPVVYLLGRLAHGFFAVALDEFTGEDIGHGFKRRRFIMNTEMIANWEIAGLVLVGLIMLTNGYMAWRRHPDSSLARVEGWKTYIAKWALFRWLFYIGFFLLWVFQEATWGFFIGEEKLKFRRLVSQVDLVIYNGQFTSPDKDKSNRNEGIFYGSD